MHAFQVIHQQSPCHAWCLTHFDDAEQMLCVGLDRAVMLQRFDGVRHDNIGYSRAEFERQQAEAERRVAPKTYPRKPRGARY